MIERKKIVLLVNNCPAHVKVETLSNINIIKLLSNTTSILQPCDMGIIQTIKIYYYHKIQVRIIEQIKDLSISLTGAAIAKKILLLSLIIKFHY